MELDYVMLVKIYGADPQGERSYSPPVSLGCKVDKVSGDPDPKHISFTWSRLAVRLGTRIVRAAPTLDGEGFAQRTRPFDRGQPHARFL
jgi:hypothetical protein